MSRQPPLDIVLDAILAELRRAQRKFPEWPADPLHACAILQEEVGELTRAILHAVYEPSKGGPKDVEDEALQVAAMAIRFLLGRYVWTSRSPQITQQPV